MSAKKGLTKEEEILLRDFSRNVSTKSAVLFYANAFIVSALPIWLFWRIHLMDPLYSSLYFVTMTVVSTYLISFANQNTQYILKDKIAVQREEAVTKEMNRKLSDDKKMSKKEKEERYNINI
ncbi:hypothetical protein QYM36_008323 [Artemia franciscana]|uniref:Translocon-associated protein subunit gamma n=1 Tax=Artemia franciscana TaxID=6661 RepID=A0AA88LLB8_ARTSF|nr:hypothetical protein QYM36_008323 [Artemia franciscana]